MKDLNGTDDYYFRDSFDRSSCDSQLQDTVLRATLPPSHRSSRSHSPQPAYRMRPGGSKSSLQTTGLSQTPAKPSPTAYQEADSQGISENAAAQKFNLFQVFVPSFLFVAISLITATVLILESESDILSNVRGLPEMITLKKQYYEPIKKFLAKKLFNYSPK